MAYSETEEARDLEGKSGGVTGHSVMPLQFPVPCPHCGKKTGQLVGTSDPSRAVVTVMITCSNCSRMWTEQAEQQPVISQRHNDGAE